MTTPGGGITHMQQKRGTAAEWAALNEVLKDGEIGFERDTGIIRIGNGVAPWNDLVPILKSVLSPTAAEWANTNPILESGVVGIERDTGIIRIGNGVDTFANLPPVLKSTFVSTTGGSTILPSGTAVKGLVVKARAGQTSNLIEFQDSTGVVKTFIGPAAGGLNTGSLVVSSDSIVQGVSFVGGSTGDSAWTGAQLQSVPSSATIKGLVVKGKPGQSANLIEVQSSDGVAKSRFNADGSFDIFGPKTGYSVQQILTQGAAVRGLVVRAAPSQTANMAEFQNDSGTPLFAVRADGKPYYSSANVTGSATAGGVTKPESYSGYVSGYVDGNLVKFPYYLA